MVHKKKQKSFPGLVDLPKSWYLETLHVEQEIYDSWWLLLIKAQRAARGTTSLTLFTPEEPGAPDQQGLSTRVPSSSPELLHPDSHAAQGLESDPPLGGTQLRSSGQRGPAFLSH